MLVTDRNESAPDAGLTPRPCSWDRYNQSPHVAIERMPHLVTASKAARIEAGGGTTSPKRRETPVAHQPNQENPYEPRKALTTNTAS